MERPIVLSENELDFIAAGQPPFLPQLGLIDVGAIVTVGDIEVELLNNNNVEIRNLLNDNVVQVGVGAAVAILSNQAAGGLVRQLA